MTPVDCWRPCAECGRTVRVQVNTSEGTMLAHHLVMRSPDDLSSDPEARAFEDVTWCPGGGRWVPAGAGAQPQG